MKINDNDWLNCWLHDYLWKKKYNSPVVLNNICRCRLINITNGNTDNTNSPVESVKTIHLLDMLTVITEILDSSVCDIDIFIFYSNGSLDDRLNSNYCQKKNWAFMFKE